jgi:type II secretory pathway component PulM
MPAMGKWTAGIKDFYGSLSERDQKVIRWGAPLIALLVVYLLIAQPLLDRASRISSTHAQLRSDLIWLLGQREHMERVNSYCPLSFDPTTDTAAEAVVIAQARRLGMNPRIETSATGYVLKMDSASGNAVLSLARELACRGLRLSELEIHRTAQDNDLISANMELQF